MGIFDDLVAADAAAFLAEFGREDIIRWPCGDQAREETITAIFDQDDETQEGNSNNGDQVRDEDGSKVLRVGLLDVPVSQEIDDRDVFLIDGKRWHVTRSQGEDAGMRTWVLERVEERGTRQTRRR